MKKVIVEVIDKETRESLEKISVTRARILKMDERTYPHIMRANALDIAKRSFCKEYEEDYRTAGARYEFKVIEEFR